MAMSSDRKVQKGKIAALKHDDAAVKTGSRLLFDDERRTAQFDGYGETESRLSASEEATAPKARVKHDSARIGFEKMVAFNETEAADARINELFALADQGITPASSKAMAGSAVFGNWAVVPSLMSFAANSGPGSASGASGVNTLTREFVEIADASVQPVPVVEQNPPSVIDGSDEIGVAAGWVGLDNSYFDESVDGARYSKADIGKVIVFGDFPASDPARTVWDIRDEYGVSVNPHFSIAWENNEWRLKAINNLNDDYFNRESDIWGPGGFLRLTVKATLIGTAKTIDGALDVHIVDVNERVLGVNHWGSLNENVSDAILVGYLGAKDTDIYWTGPYTYTISDANSPFYIGGQLGNELWKKAGWTYNYEVGIEPEVQVTVYDGRYSWTSRIIVHINDVNDLARIDSSLSGNVTEGAARLDGTITAWDEDRDASGNQRDTVTLFTTDTRFIVENGVLKVANGGTFDYETMNGQTVRVYAWDGVDEAQRFASYSDVTLNITDVNERPTGMNAYGLSISENVPAGAQNLVLFAAIDPDRPELESFKYELVSDPSGKFQIDPDTGWLSLKPDATLDHETGPRHTVTVKVMDRGGGSNSLSFVGDYTILVANANDKPTNISMEGQTTVAAGENLPFSRLLQASDQDGDTPTFDFDTTAAGGGNANGMFVIDSDTKAIKLAPNKTLDYEALPANAKFYTVYVKAWDGTVWSESQALTINVTNENEAPASVRLNNSTAVDVEENTNFSGLLTAVDPERDTLTFSFDTTAPGGGNAGGMFVIDPLDKQLKLAPGKVLDYEALPANAKYYTVYVKVSDGALSSQTQALTINITNGNDKPTDISINGRTDVTVQENQPFVRTLQATDQDGDTVTFSIDTTSPNGGNAGGMFEVDSSRGELKLAPGKVLDYEALPAEAKFYTVYVKASDGRGGETVQAITINVTNGNDAPTDVKLDNATEITVAENTPFAGSLSATDQDGNPLTFEFDTTAADGGNAGGIFMIDPLDKKLKLAPGKVLDYEALPANAKYYTVYVKANDGSATSVTQAIRINVTNVNERPSAIKLNGQTDLTVDENTAFVGDLTAFDPEGQPISYGLINNAGGMFVLDAASKQIKLAQGKKLDYEALPADAKYYTILVSASDGNSAATQSIRINVANVNEAPTAVRLNGTTSVIVGENTNFSGQLSASDPENGGLTFDFDRSASNGGDAGGMFVIDPLDKQIKLAPGKVLDYEALPASAKYHIVYVKASDGTSWSQTQALVINLTNRNDRPTDITVDGRTAVSVDENSGFIGELGATDQDGDPVTFSIDTTKPGGGDANGMFVVDSASGELRLAPGKTLDYEALPAGAKVYTVYVKASDGVESSTQALIINVADANDAPTSVTFDAESILDGTTGAGQHVVTAAAVDEDGLDSGFRHNWYRFADAEDADGLYSADGRFVINAMTGEVQTRRAMTEQDVALGRVTIKVQAYDADRPAMASSIVEHVVRIRPPNEAPVITVVSGDTSHTVDDNATVTPFDNLEFSDSWDEILTVRITWEDWELGQLENIPLPDDYPGAVIQYAEGTPFFSVRGTQEQINDIVQNLIWNPRDRANGRVGDAEDTVFQVALLDGALSDDLAVTVTSRTANRAPSAPDVTAANPDPNGQGFITITEGIGGNALIGTLASSDPNQGDTPVYTFAAGGNPHDYFRIVDNQLQLNDVALDYDNTTDELLLTDDRTIPGVRLKYFEVTLVTKDQNGGDGALTSPPKTIRVYVNDVANDAPNADPTDITIDNRNIMENSPGGTVVGTLGAVDPDSTTFRFHLVDAKFEVVETSGVWTLQLKQDAQLDSEVENHRTVTIGVTDREGGYYEEEITITITNDPTEDLADVSLSDTRVQEHAADGTTVGILALPGIEAGDVTYAFDSNFAGGGNAGGRFVLGVDDEGNPVLKVANGVKLDFEQARSHQIKIVATVAGVGTVATELRIDLDNVVQETVVDTTADGNRIHGGIGYDQIWGGAGNDTLLGGAGNDDLYGGDGSGAGDDGADVFVFNRFGTANADSIHDFGSGDRIQLVKSGAFEALSLGILSVDAFWAGLEAHDADDRIIYDQATGRLLYDSDGSGGRAAFEVATLTPGTVLSYDRIFVTEHLL